MAYWTFKRNRLVFIYTYQNDKHCQIPRKLTKHLDGQPECNIQAWVKNYEIEHENRTAPVAAITTKLLEELKAEYLVFLTNEDKHSATIESHDRALRKMVFWYFLSIGMEDVHSWPQHSIKMRDWLRERDISNYNIRLANSALRGFWKFHTEEGRIASALNINLRPPQIKKNKQTVLKYTLTPEQVIVAVKSISDPTVKLMALMGYFFSLRPQEIFALSRNKFRSGSNAASLEACKVMRNHHLFDRFAVYIDLQRDPKGKCDQPKNSSIGCVACFHEVAARLIIDLIKDKPDKECFFQFGNDWLFTLWRKKGLKGITLKDLRRASLYYLGHYTDLQYVALKNHARHADPDTTWLYLRRPDEGFDIYDDLDLET